MSVYACMQFIFYACLHFVLLNVYIFTLINSINKNYFNSFAIYLLVLYVNVCNMPFKFVIKRIHFHYTAS